jgi:hypothetical protein
MGTVLPNSPQQLLAKLAEIFTDFQLERTDENGALTYHEIMLAFTPYFGSSLYAFSVKQLGEFGSMVNKAVDHGGDLENAISTCFLEHIRQIDASKVLAPFLTREAKKRSRA